MELLPKSDIFNGSTTEKGDKFNQSITQQLKFESKYYPKMEF